MKKLFTVVLFFSVCLSSTLSQDVEQKFNSLKDRIQNDPLKVNGSFSAMGQYYQAFGIDNRAVPFSGRLMAALNFDFLGIRMPFSLAYSNGGVVFNKRLPSYSFIGISPSYKWAKVLIGTRSMDFGKYSFSNYSFTGGGFELTPGNWNVSAFYGRLRRARVEDFQGINNVDPFFRRMGFGGKAGYEDGKDKVLVSVFKAWDDGASIVIPDSSFNFFPSENVIVSAEIGKQISKRVDLEVHYSNSGFTDDRELQERTEGFRLSNYGGLLRNNISTRFNNAFEAKLNFKLKAVSFNIAYERIDPGYRTMGALFFNNDLENVSGGVNFRILKGKLNVNARGGLQRNNLSGEEANDYNRFVGSFNANYTVNDKLTFTGSATNFNNVNRRSTIVDPNSPILLTNLVLNNQQANLGANYVIANDNSRSSTLSATASLTQGNTIENDIVNVDQSSTSLNTFIYYTLQLKPSAWTFGVNTGYNRNNFGSNETAFSNVGLMAAKKLFNEKLDLGLQSNVAFNTQYQDQVSVADGQLYSLLFTATFMTSKSSAISLNSGYLHNNVVNSNQGVQAFSEFRNTLNFQYRFNPRK
ncbi:porin family protein [Portibacter lacus]|uniref:outer membrane beta-barrel protein n=1 Tax=Portibacter lacus TaxID=1099794 RepID=UPI0024E15595|nr:outer membrane beta-barrel protein [Portibacter lacus]